MRTIQPLFFGPKWVPFATLICSLTALGSSSALGVTVVVTSTADVVTGCATTGTGAVGTGGCTLRDAIIFSNANPPISPAQNSIQFNIPGSGVQTIGLGGRLPEITTATIVDGYSQPGASPNTLNVGDNAVLLISLQVASVESFPGGTFPLAMLEVNGGTGSTIRGLVVEGADAFDNGPPLELFHALPIRLESCCNSVVGNFIGVDPTGTVGGIGGLEVRSARNQIGAAAPADRNVARGQIQIEFVDRNTIENNYIGTNAAGNAGLGSAEVDITGGSFNTVGPANVISGGDGVSVQGGNGNLISGNFIGTDATGTLPVPNGRWGILVTSLGTIVGTPPGPPINSFFGGNRIAFNNGPGVLVTPNGSFASRANSIRSNAIFSNDGLGIDLSGCCFVGDGVTANDPCDADTGANDLQNFPVLTGATALKFKTEIEGTLNSNPSTTYDIQLFSNSSCDPSGFGEGETLVGEVFVTTDGSCNASFKTSVPVADAPAGRFITATATDPEGNTSEFSACQEVVLFHPITRTRLLIEGPVRVAPGVPVEFAFRVETTPPGMAGDLSGEAIISDDQGDLCRAQVSSRGEGACSLTFAQAGQYLVRAHYLGNSTFDDSTSPPVPVLVGMPGGR